MRSMLKARALIVCVVAAGLTMVGSADAAAPNYILVSGSGLKKPILLGNWGENHSLDLSFTNGRPAPKNVIVGLAHRSRLDLAEFWGWGPPSPVPKHPREANQHARSTPARDTACGRGRCLQRSKTVKHSARYRPPDPRPPSRTDQALGGKAYVACTSVHKDT